MLTVYVGWDSKEPEAFDVCKHSIEETASETVSVIPLKKQQFIERQLYWRQEDSRDSTEFTMTRFMVPWLNGYYGKAVFCDCDFLFETDIMELVAQFDKTKAVQVVKHDYTPKEKTKFHGHTQHVYPRKNWSSLVLWNCEHEANRALNLDVINSKDPSYLHQFKWLQDDEIGELSHEWNWLEGHYQEPEDGSPKAIHFTRGGPWFEGYENVQYADRWLAAQKRLKEKDDDSPLTRELNQRHNGSSNPEYVARRIG